MIGREWNLLDVFMFTILFCLGLLVGTLIAKILGLF